ncbi:hypothetical protein E1B28_001523 [Marasmius oreades]|uniref:Fork-head domain-containing protein n=1 Tax=Marasmius oreades TaxID=181124 RepID=A0A9P8AFM7_9AGAR|nr:uncharacterized protein E1B28_001523 [Marasmius oreades]KAG7099703.1 hypothetical protein E1B28_001523 [Marasmius oreades]
MSSLSNLLNPVNRKLPPMSPSENEHSPLHSQPEENPSSPGSTASDEITAHHPEDPHEEEDMNADDIPPDDDHVPEDIHVPNIPHNPDHRPHPNCPDTLACLPDTEGRPQHTLPVILRCAILGSPRKRLTIREIYAAMEGKYAYYRTAGQTWKQSVRHHLSLNRLFERQPRPVTDPGFGSYWTVNLAAPPGTKRPRKRGRPNKNKDAAPPTAPVVKELDLKRRGRPRKDSEPPPLTGSSSGATTSDINMHGRSEDELLDSDEERDSTQILHPFERRSSLVGLTLYPTGAGDSTLDGNGYATIEKLQNEIASLRQQANDAVQLSIRLSDQLAQAHAEASRAKSNLRNVETLLEEESSKRMDAEKQAAEESKLKKEAQEALRATENVRRDDETARREEGEEKLRSSGTTGTTAT